jgi:hypothetical protein
MPQAGIGAGADDSNANGLLRHREDLRCVTNGHGIRHRAVPILAGAAGEQKSPVAQAPLMARVLIKKKEIRLKL